MIFISHTNKDKPIVEPIAERLAKVYGISNVFYDSWSIQPGDGIIDRMNDGLEKCRFFFFFVSKNSLQSNMVKIEWQNAIYKATNGQAKIIPVKLDDCLMPAILLQTLYIDVYGKGIENAVRQIVDIIDGKNIFSSKGVQPYENIRGTIIQISEKEVDIEFRAETYMEPISRYLVVLNNEKRDISHKCLSDSTYKYGFNKNVITIGNETFSAILFCIDRATTPNFPAKFKVISEKKIDIKMLMRAESEKYFQSIPYNTINA